MINTSKKIKDMQKALSDFLEKIKNGEIVLPGNLAQVDENTQASWPNAIIYQQKVLPIIYDEDSNTITIAP